MLSDLDIGMNDWVVPRLKWNDGYSPDRGRVLRAEELEKLQKFLRYMPEDGTGIAPRTLAGVHPNGAYFTRGSGHNKYGGYTENPDEYQEVIDRLKVKHRSASSYVPAPFIERRAGARIGLITIGGCDPAVREALGSMERNGHPASFLRIRGFPFADSIASCRSPSRRRLNALSSPSRKGNPCELPSCFLVSRCALPRAVTMTTIPLDRTAVSGWVSS